MDLRVRDHMGLEDHLIDPPILDQNPLCGRKVETPVHEVGVRFRNQRIIWEDGLWDREDAHEVGNGSDAVGEGGEDDNVTIR